MSRVLLLLLLLPLQALAGISIELRDSSVPIFLQTVVRGLLGRDFVVSSDVPAEKKISVFIKNMEADKAAALAFDLLRSQGLSVEEKHGVVFVGVAAGASNVATLPPVVDPPGTKPDKFELAPPVPLEWVIYRPRRPAAIAPPLVLLPMLVFVIGSRF